jgi:hypothetical protein
MIIVGSYADRAAGPGQQIHSGFFEERLKAIAINSHGMGSADLHETHRTAQRFPFLPDQSDQSRSYFFLPVFFHGLR